MAEFATSVIVVFAIIGIGALIGGPISFYLFYRLRNQHPITGRPLKTYLATAFFMWLYILTQCLRTLFEDKVPCILYYIMTEPNLNLIVCPLLLVRLWMTFYSFKETQEKYSPDSDQWYIRRHYLVSSKFISCVFAAHFAVFMILPIVLITEDIVDCEDPLRTRLYTYPISLIPVNLLLFMTWKYQVLQDGYWIKTELKLFAYQVAMWMPVQMILIGVYWNDNLQYMVSDRISGTLGAVWFNITAILFPVFMVYRSGHSVASLKDKIHAGESSSTFLQDVLDNKAMREAFLQHLMKEFNVENMMYLDALDEIAELFSDTNDRLEDYKSRSDSASSESITLIRKANVKFVEQYVMFFIDESPLQVNISWSARDAVENEVKNICDGELPQTIINLSDIVDNTRLADYSVYDESRREIFRLLEDVYPRFMMSQLFIEVPPPTPRPSPVTKSNSRMTELTEV